MKGLRKPPAKKAARKAMKTRSRTRLVSGRWARLAQARFLVEIGTAEQQPHGEHHQAMADGEREIVDHALRLACPNGKGADTAPRVEAPLSTAVARSRRCASSISWITDCRCKAAIPFVPGRS